VTALSWVELRTAQKRGHQVREQEITIVQKRHKKFRDKTTCNFYFFLSIKIGIVAYSIQPSILIRARL